MSAPLLGAHCNGRMGKGKEDFGEKREPSFGLLRAGSDTKVTKGPRMNANLRE